MISLIIPMYNEKSVIAESIGALCDAFGKITDEKFEIIVSDDGSTDGCGDIARECARSVETPNVSVRVISAEKNSGKGSAVRMGILEASGDIVLFTDSDLAYGTDIITVMANELRASSADILIGSRAIHPEGYAGYTFVRKAASRAFIRLIALSAGFKHTDSQCGIKAFRCRSAKKIFSKCTVNGWAFDFEVLMIAGRMGIAVEEYPVKIINHRESKISLVKDAVRMMRDVRSIKKRVRSMKL